MGMKPYYLYRQKNTIGNLENVGYAKPGYACLYNIDNMEETTRILAQGAGERGTEVVGGGEGCGVGVDLRPLHAGAELFVLIFQLFKLFKHGSYAPSDRFFRVCIIPYFPAPVNEE